MGDDDDQDCVEHVWVLDELHLTLDHSGVGERCQRCGAWRYGDVRRESREPL